MTNSYEIINVVEKINREQLFAIYQKTKKNRSHSNHDVADVQKTKKKYGVFAQFLICLAYVTIGSSDEGTGLNGLLVQ